MSRTLLGIIAGATGIPAPTNVTAAQGTAGTAVVSFTNVPSATTYTVTSSPGGVTASGGSSPITVTGLTGGTSYTFTVTATVNGEVTEPSSPSNAVAVLTQFSQTFTASGTFTPPSGITQFEVLVVAGGGGGGGTGTGTSTGSDAGGGAGGIVYHSSFAITAPITVTVGAGGAQRANGSNSSLGALVAIGGGKGGLTTTGDGGSGGGVPAWGNSRFDIPGQSTQTSPSGGTGYGNRGGIHESPDFGTWAAAGGGGAGAVGGPIFFGIDWATNSYRAFNPGNGGAGLQFFGSWYGGGGGGGNYYPNAGAFGYGGIGGGGNGGWLSNGQNGTANTGGGGGGKGQSKVENSSGAGGSGIVIVRWVA